MFRKELLSIFFLLVVIPMSLVAEERSYQSLATVQWMHGSANCELARAQPSYVEWQKVQYAAGSYVFRQNKCSNYEAPFVYLFVGGERALLIDTGATEQGGSSLALEIRAVTSLPVIVAHSHGHGDHRAGDAALRSHEGFSVAGTSPAAVQASFGFKKWPSSSVFIDLGGRNVELLPIPGHNDDDIAFYDSLSEVVVTGDTFYPGRLYIGSWPQYRSSIQRLVEWLASKKVRHILGTHIEMSSADNVDYPIGTTYQPDEAPLPLTLSDLRRLYDATGQMENPKRTYLQNFVIWPKS